MWATVAHVTSSPGSVAESCLTRNEWICSDYYASRAGVLGEAVVQHVTLVVVSVLIGLALAAPLALLARRYTPLRGVVLGATTAIYTIPSLALFSLLVPLTGLGSTTVVIGLALYSLTILVRAIMDGLAGVPADVVEAARGMGYGDARLLRSVELPLALPAVMAGLRVATVSTVALVTVGAILDFGGLGQLLISGKETDFRAQVLATSVLCVVLAIVFDLVLVAIERLLTPWTRVARGAAA